MKKYINSLNIVRAFVFLCVLLSHSKIIPLGHLGVAIFIMLSGFLFDYNYGESNIRIPGGV